MKTLKDYILYLESEAATNVVSAGAIATTEPPLGAVKKRKTLESVLSVTSTGVTPLADVYAVATPAEFGDKTEPDSDDLKKHVFHMKQQHQNDQTSNL